VSDPALWTLAEAAAAIAARRISARELLEACLARAALWQPVTNAFIDQRTAPAASAADAADLQAPRTKLHGIPLAHKDMFYREGQISTCGSTLRRHWQAPTTATVLRRLDAAGALDLGTLNMAEWAGGATGHNPWFGDTCNPWNPEFASGGSSSGAGAAVAARMVFAALGSDTGGSIRLPASMCGIAGLKPTSGAVSRHGVMPRAWTLDVVGPLARTAEDCALIFAAIAGPDPQDPTSANARAFTPPSRPGSLRGQVIGVEAGMLAAADATLQPALATALALLRNLGAELREVAIPDLPTIFDLGGVISGAEAASLHLDAMRDTPEGFAPDLFHRMQAGLATPAVLYLQALRSRGELLRRVQAAIFTDCTALFCPSIAVPVPTREASRTRTAEDVGRIHGPLVRLTRPFNMLGLPSLSMPCGFDRAGLPVGFQLVGAPFDEAAILAIGMAYEHAAGWHRRMPEMPSAPVSPGVSPVAESH
jgi:aspartyl-tRNA(Asn)/glutamyl-tRNA(Gln) amidotransferase subunit A